MNGQDDLLRITELLSQMPKPSMPADLIAAIEAQTIHRISWWQSDTFRLRWAPALVGIATALGALWLSRIQAHPGPRAAIPMAARPMPQPESMHAFVTSKEPSNSEKGDRREYTKS